ncbi:MAG: hypothetical protein QG641_685, partial [Candidatus Poribacteria bacterium]|nr:hypothetical protein [Candidatus Poribacteria bacterium]
MFIEISCLVFICLGFFIVCLFSQECVGKEQIKVKPNIEKVGEYEKIEFQINLDTVYSNPFDPDEVDLSLDIKSPSGKIITIPAFCYQYYERGNVDKGGRIAEWLYPIGKPIWKARYAPNEIGKHFCSAKLKDRHGLTQSDAVSFDCTASQSKGFVHISRIDPRFFEFSNGSVFFPIGQNLAFIGETQYVTVPKAGEIFKKMSDNGANFARIWTCCEDWAMAIEARKSVWGRSWYWNPSIVQVPGRMGYLTDYKCIQIAGEEGTRVDLSPCHPIALKPDTKYVVSGSARTDADADLNIESNNAKTKIIHDKNKEWTDFEYEFVTSPSEWWLDNMRFVMNKKGIAWI